MSVHRKFTFVFFFLSLFSFVETGCSKEGKPSIGEVQASYEKIKEANNFISDNKVDSAFKRLEKINHSSFNVNDSLYIYYLNTKAFAFFKEGNSDSALKYYVTASRLLLTPETEHQLSESYSKVSILFLQHDIIDSVQRYTTKAVELLSKQKKNREIAALYTGLGEHYKKSKRYQESLDNLYKSLYYLDQLEDTLQLALTYNSIGIIYHYIEKRDEAKESFEKGVALAQKAKSAYLLESIYNNLSTLYQHGYGNYEKASEYLRLAFKHSFPDNKSHAVLSANMGFLFLENKVYDSAFYCFRYFLQTSQQAKESANYVEILRAMGYVFWELNKLDSAYYYTNLSLKMACEHNWLDNISRTYEQLSYIDIAKHDYKSALENFRNSILYRDSLFEIDYMSRVEELKLQFEAEKKDAELDFLNEQNKIINRKVHTQMYVIVLALLLIVLTVILMISMYGSRQKIIMQHKEIADQKEKITFQVEALEVKNQQLNDLVKTKDKFFSIISHDLRGPFHSLTGLLDLMLEDFNSFSEEEKYEYIQLMRNTSQNSYELLEMLLEWSRAQRGLITCSPETINAYDFVNSAIDLAEARAANKSQKLLNLVNPTLNVYVDQKLIKTILNNLINNSIKFTLTGGTIEISVEEKPEEIIFCVSDNGIGMPQDKADKIFSINSDFKRKGTSNESGTGLGLIIVKEFISLMKGVIWAESKENFGTKIYFAIPKES